MNRQARQSQTFLSQLKFLAIVLLILSLWFRFTNLDRKVYSYDEAITSLRISGYTWTEMVQQDFQGKAIRVDYLQQKYQSFTAEKTFKDTLKGLATEEPQLTPLYFILVRFWAKLWGTHCAVTRSFSALISLLIFPTTYWLCLELFASSLVGWVAISLMAVSPFHFLYAQDARPYSLLTVAILLSGAGLLQALRLNTKKAWGIYTLSIVFGLYSHLLFALVIIGQGIYTLLTQARTYPSKILPYCLSLLAAGLTFLPWLVILIQNSHEIKDTVGLPELSGHLLSSIKPGILIVSRLFLDTHWAGGVLDLGIRSKLTDLLRLILIGLLLCLIGYAFYFICRYTSPKIWLFLLTLTGITTLLLVVTHNLTDRYFVAGVLGIQITLAFLLTTQMTTASSFTRQKLWQLIFISLIVSGVVSCSINSQAQLWWNKYPSSTKDNPKVAGIINQTPHPLVISHGRNNITGNILSLSYLLKPDVKLQLVTHPHLVKIPNDVSDIFLYRPTQALQLELKTKQNYQIKPLYKSHDVWLWRLEQ